MQQSLRCGNHLLTLTHERCNRSWYARHAHTLPRRTIRQAKQLKAILFLVASRRLSQHEVTERRGDGLGRVFLPGLGFESYDAPALLDDRGVGVAVERATGAQVVDCQADRLRQR